jgi:hypothetical protein
MGLQGSAAGKKAMLAKEFDYGRKRRAAANPGEIQQAHRLSGYAR